MAESATSSRAHGYPLVAVGFAVLGACSLLAAPGESTPATMVKPAVLLVAVALGFALGLLSLRKRREVARPPDAAEPRSWKDFFYRSAWGAVIADTAGTILAVNPAFARMHGYESQELLGKPAELVFAPAWRPRVPEIFAAVHAGGHLRFEAEHVRKDGSTFPVLVDSTAVSDDHGRVSYRAVYVQDMTAVKAAELAHSRLAALVEGSNDAILLAKADGSVLAWNRGAQRIYGYTAGEAARPGFLESVVPPERKGEIAELIARALRGEDVTAFETERVRKDGSRFAASLTISAVRDPVGGTPLFSATIRDITEQVNARVQIQKAHRSERRLRQQLELVSAAGVDVSSALAAMPEAGLEALIDTIVRHARALAGASWASIDLGGGEEGSPSRRGPDQPELGEALAVPIVFRERVFGTLHVAKRAGAGGFIDEDERMIAELAARAGVALYTAELYTNKSALHARLQTILDQMPEGVIVVDEAGVVTDTNRAMRRLESEHYGVRSVDVRQASGEPIADADLPLARVLHDGEPILSKELLVCVEGHQVPVLASAAPVKTPSGVLLGAVETFQDISAIKEFERLRQEWGSLVAHDLRQPLNTITLGAQLVERHLAEHGGSHSTLATARKIVTSAWKLDRLIGDLRDVSRIEARRLDLAMGDVSLRELVHDAVERYARIPGYEAHINERGSGRQIRADAGRLDQVLSNLLSNAIKYGEPSTPILLAVDWRERDVEVAITNRGEGISREDLPTIFDRFSRTDAARASGQEGMGLGLYLSKGLVEAHGGRIWAESTPGQETTFHVVLPAPPMMLGGHDAVPAPRWRRVTS
jgi:PAS domain S-box-containing protein